MRIMQYAMYKYSLEKKSEKHLCPLCGKKRFVRYVDSETGDYLSYQVGRCDREIKCGHHYSPKSYFKNRKQNYYPIVVDKTISRKFKSEISLHSNAELQQSLAGYLENNFVQFLNKKFQPAEVSKMLKDYKIGTATNCYNSTIFWQIDENQKIRGGKIIKYNISGKRTKYINWVHSIKLKKKEIIDFELSQCLYGLHLLRKYDKIIAIVESEKTACIMSLFFDRYLWMATGSLSGLTLKKIEALEDRKIILYPDLGTDHKTLSPFNQWKQKCEEFKKIGLDIEISDLLERKATSIHREKGYDLADYFLENQSNKPRKIISKHQQKFIDLYMKNRNLKTLIDVFDLRDENDNKINFL